MSLDSWVRAGPGGGLIPTVLGTNPEPVPRIRRIDGPDGRAGPGLPAGDIATAGPAAYAGLVILFAPGTIATPISTVASLIRIAAAWSFRRLERAGPGGG